MAIMLTVVGFVNLVINLIKAACNVLFPLHHYVLLAKLAIILVELVAFYVKIRC